MRKKGRLFFAEALPKQVRWFEDRELDVWSDVLRQIGARESNIMINDCYKNIEKDSLANVDYSELVELAKEIGIMDKSICLDSFRMTGLLN